MRALLCSHGNLSLVSKPRRGIAGLRVCQARSCLRSQEAGEDLGRGCQGTVCCRQHGMMEGVCLLPNSLLSEAMFSDGS